MLKYIGIILISLSVSMYGTYLSVKIRERKDIRNALLELLIYIKRSIENTYLPLDEIYKNFSNKSLEKIGFTKELCSGKKDAFLSAINIANAYLNNKLIELYHSISLSLGKSYSGNLESQKLAGYILMIEEECKTLDKEDNSKRELYRKLGLLCGLFAAIILM